VLLFERLDELIGAPALVALLALRERIDEGRDVPGRLPDLRGEDDRGVQAHDVVATAHDGLPPLALDVLFEFYAERAVVPGGAGAAVDLG
jgi:hypothetical protein